MKKVYQNMNKKAFWLCLATSIILLVAGFLCPPLAKIDGSVLTGIGELALFATLAVVGDAVSKGSDITVKKGDFEVSVDNEPESGKED